WWGRERRRCSRRPHRVADDGFEVFGFGAAWVAQVDFVMEAHGGHGAVGIKGVQERAATGRVGYVVYVSGCGDERLHGLDGGWLVVIRPHVHDLGARSLGES